MAKSEIQCPYCREKVELPVRSESADGNAITMTINVTPFALHAQRHAGEYEVEIRTEYVNPDEQDKSPFRL